LIFATAREFGIFNNSNITAMLFCQLQNISERKLPPVVDLVQQISDPGACASLESHLSQKFGKKHALVKIFVEQRVLLSMLGPFANIEKTKLKTQISDLEKKVQKLEQENTKLRLAKGLSVTKDDHDDSTTTNARKTKNRGFTVC